MTDLPSNTVVACPQWRTTCRDTKAVPYPYWNCMEPPLCHHGHAMNVQVELRDWQAGVGWPQ